MGQEANDVSTIVLFIFAGIAEIGGGYFIWLWLREGKPYWYGIVGGLILVLYGAIPTLQKFLSFGRGVCGLWRCIYHTVAFVGLGRWPKNAGSVRLDWCCHLSNRGFYHPLGAEAVALGRG